MPGAWELPGSPTARRAAIYGTAGKVAARYGRLRLPLSPGVGQAHDAGARDIFQTAVRLRGGFLHADPHPGNFLLQPGPRLGVVDFGACDELSEPTRLAMRSLYAAGIRNDLNAAVEALDALGFKTRSGSLDALVQWASLFAFEDTGENMEGGVGEADGRPPR